MAIPKSATERSFRMVKSIVHFIEFKGDELHIFWRDFGDGTSAGPMGTSRVNQSYNLSSKDKYHKSIFHAIWLRDNDQGPQSRHPLNGQRLFNIVDVPEDIYIANAKLVSGITNQNGTHEAIELKFSGNNGTYEFECRFDATWLRTQSYCDNLDTSKKRDGECLKNNIRNLDVIERAPFNNVAVPINNRSDVQWWDKGYFQNICNDPNNPDTNAGPFQNGLQFHDYNTLLLLDKEWKQNYYKNKKCLSKESQSFYEERRIKFKPLFDFLKDFIKYGFMLLKGVPAREGEILNLPSLFDGYVRETNYGPTFDVVAKKNPNNLAYTNLAVTPHTDNPYRNPVPSIQILHCLKNECDGGLTGLVDGFMAAEKIRQLCGQEVTDNIDKSIPNTKNYFHLLSNYFVPYEYHNRAYDVMKDDDIINMERNLNGGPPEQNNLQYVYNQQSAYLRHRQPIIELDDRGKVIAVAFNNRSASAFDFPSSLGEENSLMTDFYAAYRKFAQVIFDEKMQFNIKMQPGDAIIFDNRRVLHARTSFSYNAFGKESSPRHLQGCYSDKDAVFSKYLLMMEELGESTYVY